MDQNNIDRIQRNIDMTIVNMRQADEIINTTLDRQLKQTLITKNQRREQALESMRNGMQG